MRVRLITGAAFIAFVAFAAGFQAHKVGALRFAIDPLVKKDRATPSIYARVREQLFEAYPVKADVVIVGDSIAEWVDWSAALPGLSVASRAIAGDTVPAVLARIKGIAGTGAGTAVVMLGNNDFEAHAGVDEVLADYVRLLDAMAGLGMTSHVFPVLTGALELRSTVLAFNVRLAGLCAKRPDCRFHGLDAMVLPDGSMHGRFTIDGSHLSAEGYGVFVAAVRAAIGGR